MSFTSTYTSYTHRSSPPTTIGELPNHQPCVSPNTLGKFVAKELEQNTKLPGVLVVSAQNQLLGVISRQKCFEQLGRPFGVEVFLNRPIYALIEQLGLPPTVLAGATRIEEAAESALQRPADQLYEPIVVSVNEGDYRLLDLHILLLAQSELLANANTVIHQQAEIQQALTSSIDLGQVLQTILDHLAVILPYDRASIMLEKASDPAHGQMYFAAERGFRMDMKEKHIAIKTGDVYDQIHRTGQPLYIPDVSKRSDWQHLPQMPKARSWIGIPLVATGQVIGILSLTRVADPPYQKEDVFLGQRFAMQASVALQNSCLYEEIRMLNQDLEDKVKERTQALRQAYQQLEQLDKTKSDFIAVASNELQSPLMVVNQYSQMLLLSSTIQTSSGLTRMITEMNAAIKRLDGVVEMMLDVARVDNQELVLNFQPVALEQIFSRLQREYDKVLQARDLTLTIHYDALNMPAVRGDPDALYKVFNHLLQNAIKFTPNGGHIYVHGRKTASNGSDEEDSVEIVMQDTGVGIAPEQLETVFSKFYQTGKVSLHNTSKLHFKGGGAGLGLAIVRGIVDACKGKVWAESPGHSEETFPGSSFFVQLPAISPPAAIPVTLPVANRVTENVAYEMKSVAV